MKSELSGIDELILGAALFAALAVAGVTALALVFWGKRIPRKGDWLVLLVLVGFAVLLGAQWFELQPNQLGHDPLVLMRGWIGPRAEAGSVLIGFFQDYAGILVAFLFVAFSLLLLADRKTVLTSIRPERIYASCLMVTIGVLISWMSATLWVILFGSVICLLGGFLALISHSDAQSGAPVAIRFLREKIWGIVLALTGAFLIASHGAQLSLSDHTDTYDSAGALLLMIGMMVQLGPFPLIGWSLLGAQKAEPQGSNSSDLSRFASSETPLFYRVYFSLVLPAFTVFAVFHRFYGILKKTEFFHYCGYYLIAAAIISLASAFAQQAREKKVLLGSSALLSVCGAAYILSGPYAGFSIALGSLFGLVGLTWRLESETPRKPFECVLSVMAALVSVGAIGTVGVGGWAAWFTESISQPPVLVLLIVFVLLLSVLLLKIVFTSFRAMPPRKRSERKQPPEIAPQPQTTFSVWYPKSVQVLWIFLGVGIFWSGSLTGGLFFSGSGAEPQDLVLISIFSHHLGLGFSNLNSEESGLLMGGFILQAVLLVSVALSWYMARTPGRFVEVLATKIPGVISFFREGCRVDTNADRLYRWVLAVFITLEHRVPTKIFHEAIPRLLSFGVTGISRRVLFSDRMLINGIQEVTHQAITRLARVLRIVHNGDVQVYLFFAIGSVLLILIHFIKTGF